MLATQVFWWLSNENLKAIRTSFCSFPEHLLPFVDEVTSACSRLHAELEWLRECARMTSPEVEVYAAGLNSQLCHKIWT